MRRLFWLFWSLLVAGSACLCTIGCLLPRWLDGSLDLTSYEGVDPTLLLQSSLSADSTKTTPSSLGLFRRCIYPVYLNPPIDNHEAIIVDLDSSLTLNLTTTTAKIRHHHHHQLLQGLVELQYACGRYAFKHIPHIAWKIALIALSLSCAGLAFLTFFILLSGFDLVVLFDTPNVYRSCQVGLLVSGCLAIIPCILFPIGWIDNEEIKQICGSDRTGFQLGRCQIGPAYILTLSGAILAFLSSIAPSLCVNCLITTSQPTPPGIHPISNSVSKDAYQCGDDYVIDASSPAIVDTPASNRVRYSAHLTLPKFARGSG